MRLFLTSSFFADASQIDRFLSLLKKDPRDAKLIFVPTAGNGQGEISLFYRQKTLADFSSLGFSPICYDLAEKQPEDVQRDLADVDVIWVGGGNTFYLLQEARRSGFLAIAAERIRDHGVLYGGTSAGSILATTSIEMAGIGEDADVNTVGITDLSALGVMDGSVQVHYEPALHDAVLAEANVTKPLYLVPDGGAIVVDGLTCELLGGVQIRR